MDQLKRIQVEGIKCLNQHFVKGNPSEPICTGSEKLDYRPAWITDKPIDINEE